MHVEGGGSVNLEKKNYSATICPEKGFRDASCMFKKAIYQEVIRDSLA